MKRHTRLLFEILILGFVLAAIGGLYWINLVYSRQQPGGNDFLARWMGARYWLIEGISPYDEQVSLATQIAIYGRPADRTKGEDIAHFVYPLPVMIFIAPFAFFEYTVARALWMTFLELCVIGLAFLSFRLSAWQPSPLKLGLFVLVFTLGYYSVRAIILGQYAVVNALLILFSLLAIRRKSDFVAGFLIALSLCKPQMVFLFVPFVLIWAWSQRRWDIFGGFFGGGGLILAISLMFLPDWPIQMLRQVMDYPAYTRESSPISILASLTPGVKRQIEWILYSGLLGYLLLEWGLAWKKEYAHFLWVALLTLLVSNLVAYRTATTHYLVLYPALALIFRVLEERWRDLGRGLVWIVMLVWFIGSWLLFFSTVQGNQESDVMFLPFPFLTLLGLWWIRWWQVRPPVTELQVIRNKVD
ncbi:MAG: DUF2029 domain-containing protein [Anaerolineales bacterium]|nr:DUF2029 domain-containing protein [Anaerolineales bacterium]MDW8160857.1 glycosyltransferase family 87 protein [Anaerolineales bacterium]